MLEAGSIKEVFTLGIRSTRTMINSDGDWIVWENSQPTLLNPNSYQKENHNVDSFILYIL